MHQGPTLSPDPEQRKDAIKLSTRRLPCHDDSTNITQRPVRMCAEVPMGFVWIVSLHATGLRTTESLPSNVRGGGARYYRIIKPQPPLRGS